MTGRALAAIDRDRLAVLLEREVGRFRADHPRSLELHQRSKGSLLFGVPMSWMSRWAGGFPVYLDEAKGARVRDVDGHEYVDLCLGDTGAMAGHAPQPVVRAIGIQAERGATAMLPTEDGAWIGEELARRFGLPLWQFALTATDANRWALRLAREVTGRTKILVFDWCYHGSVDEALAATQHGVVGPRLGNVGPAIHPALTTKVVQFNDLYALEQALEPGDVACVLAEPALTNIGIVLPEDGFHEGLRNLTRETGTLLAIDETHTLSAGPGGCTRAWGLEPDLVTVGKAIGGGMPAAAYGVTAELAERIAGRTEADYEDVGGIGGTLAGNALSLAATRATLEHVLTEQAYERTIPLAERFASDARAAIEQHGLPWHVTELGCRAEYRFRPEPPRDGAEAAAAVDPELEQYMHLHALNRGVLLTPFHNMALMCPATTEADVEAHGEAFRAALQELV
ncbi:MAG TPA: aspartate aminotransferase family protein [Gaiellaceae bacterium]